MEYLLKEVHTKLKTAENTLQKCEQEVLYLTKNFETAKYSISKSLDRHIETLQCRSKWLSCHLNSSYHLKRDSLQTQISELQETSCALKGCLKAADSADVDGEYLRNLVKQTLIASDGAPLWLTENGSMKFTCDNEKLEEMIIGFGEVDIRPQAADDDEEEEYDLLLDVDGDDDDDDDIVVFGRSKEEQIKHSMEKTLEEIELKMKSIEMQHMTSESALEDLKKLDFDDDTENEEEEEENMCWLVQRSKAASPNCEFDSPGYNSMWLMDHEIIECENDYENVTPPFSFDDEIANAFKNNHVSSYERPTFLPSEDIKDWTVNVSQDNKWMTSEDNDMKVTSLVSFEHFDRPLFHWMSSEINTESHDYFENRHFIDPLMKSKFNSAPKMADVYSKKEKNEINGTKLIGQLNVAHYDTILNSNLSLYLRKPEISTNVKTGIETNENVEHMDAILKRPLQSYLKKPTGPSSDHSSCAWLVGKSSEQCKTCSQTCAFETDNNEWLKTATGW